MGLSNANVDALAGAELYLRAIEHDRGRTADDKPVLEPLGMALITQALARLNDDALDLVIHRSVVKDTECSPRSNIEFTPRCVCLIHNLFPSSCGAFSFSAANLFSIVVKPPISVVQ